SLRRERRAMWDECLPLFRNPVISQDDIDYPRLDGVFRSHPVTLEPIADHVGYRKLPQLWVRITAWAELPFRGTLDLLMRPENTEFYSAVWSLPIALNLPANWPEHAVLRTNSVTESAPLTTVEPHLALLNDPRLKELVVAPRGVRLVYQLAQGERANYSVFRTVKFARARIENEVMERLLQSVVALANDLRQSKFTQQAAM
ncbi:MAG: hypothetical protein U1F34_09505, partial [Gammaproteobacteria bacterium]